MNKVNITTPENEIEKVSLNEICLADLNKQANINKLKKELNKKLIPNVTSKDDDGYALIKEKLKLSQKARTGIEKTRVEHKAEALKYGKFVDGSAAELKEMVISLEKPWSDKKFSIDEAERIKIEKEQNIEIVRINEIQVRVDYIISTASNLVGKGSDYLQEKLNLVTQIVIDDSYDEFRTSALFHKEEAVNIITSALQEKLLFEKQKQKTDEANKALELANSEIARLKSLSATNESSNIDNNDNDNDYGISGNKDINYNTDNPITLTKNTDKELVSNDFITDYSNLNDPEKITEFMNRLINVRKPHIKDENIISILKVMENNLIKLSAFVQSKI